MKNKKTALIFGITGQDGSYLTKLLIESNPDLRASFTRQSFSFSTSIILYIQLYFYMYKIILSCVFFCN